MTARRTSESGEVNAHAPKPGRRVEREVRERWILRAARELFLLEGFEGFSIEGIAERMDTSRALVYAHFPSKEEILLALALESKTKRLQLLEQTLQFEGRPRERLVAVGLMEGQLLDSDVPVEVLVTLARLRAKTTAERQGTLRELELRLQLLGSGIVLEAVSAGDLKLPGHCSPEQLYFSLWSAVWGATAVRHSDYPLAQAGVTDPTETMHRSLSVMLDGYGWRPLSHEWDYRGTCRRVEREIFAQPSFQRLATQYEELFA